MTTPRSRLRHGLFQPPGPLLAMAIPAAMILLTAAIYFGFIRIDTSEDFIPILDDANLLSLRSGHLANVQSAIDSTAAMLFAIHFGLFVLVGFALNVSSQRNEPRSRIVILSALAFVACSFVSIHFGYVARLLTIERLVAGYLDFGAVMEAMASQGLWLTFAAIFAIATVSLIVVGVPAATAAPAAAPSGANAESSVVAAVLVAVALLAPAEAYAKVDRVCGDAEADAKLSALPDFIVVAQDANPQQVLSEMIGCTLDASMYAEALAGLEPQTMAQAFPNSGLAAGLASPPSAVAPPAAPSAAVKSYLLRNVQTRFESEPPGAGIMIQGREVAKTSVTALINWDILTTIEMHLDGYAPCGYANMAVQLGVVRCTLTPAQVPAEAAKP